MSARLRLALALFFSLAYVGSARAASISEEEAARIERYVRAEAAASRIPSYAFALVTREQGVVLARGVGEDVQADTPLQIGSLTKSVTALAAMQLVERGKLELDAPVQRYLPTFRVADPGASARITVRHLLNQTSGFMASAGCYGADTRTPEERLRGLATIAVRPAGTRTQYCNANYEVLGLVLEAASGQRFGDLVRQSLFEPVGMKHAYADIGEATGRGLAYGHHEWLGLFSVATRGAPPATIAAAGGIAASAADMGRWVSLHLNGGVIDGQRVASEASIGEVLRPPEGKRYGMGWRAVRVGDLDTRQHDGSVSVFTSSMMIAPAEGVGVVVLATVEGFPLPYAELHAHDIAAGALRMLAGREPPVRTIPQRLGLRTMKWPAMAVVLASLAQLAVSLRRRSSRPWSWPKTAALSAIDLGIVWALLVGAPQIPDIPLSTVYYCAPDLGAALVLGAALAVLRIALRVRRARLARRTA